MISLEHTATWGPFPPRAWRLKPVEPRRGLSYTRFFLGAVVILFLSSTGFLYIREVISTAASGYDITALERRAEGLRVHESALELETAQLQALARVEQRIRSLSLVPVSELTYARPTIDTVVTSQIPVGSARP